MGAPIKVCEYNFCDKILCEYSKQKYILLVNTSFSFKYIHAHNQLTWITNMFFNPPTNNSININNSYPSTTLSLNSFIHFWCHTQIHYICVVLKCVCHLRGNWSVKKFELIIYLTRNCTDREQITYMYLFLATSR